MATGDIGLTRLRRALFRELLVALMIGLILAALASLEMHLYGKLTLQPGYCSFRVIVTLFLSMLTSLTWAGLIGALVPVGCHLSGRIDPAIASGPFVTITCDISASLIFLTIAYFMLGPMWPPIG